MSFLDLPWRGHLNYTYEPKPTFLSRTEIGISLTNHHKPIVWSSEKPLGCDTILMFDVLPCGAHFGEASF